MSCWIIERIFPRNNLAGNIASETSHRIFIYWWLNLTPPDRSGTLYWITDIRARYNFVYLWNLELHRLGRLVKILLLLSNPYVSTAATCLTRGSWHALYALLRKQSALIDTNNPAHMAGTCLLILLEDCQFLDWNLISYDTGRLIFFFCSVAEGPLLHSMFTFINFIDGLCCRIIYSRRLGRLHYGHLFLVDEADQLYASVIWHLGIFFPHCICDTDF